MLTVKTLPLDFIPRPYQQNLFHAFFRREPKKRAMIVWSRRFGKDRSCWSILVLKALQRKGNYFVIFPTARQGRKAIWLGIDAGGVSFLDHIPDRLIAKTNNTEMRLHLINGSVIQLIGAANYNHALGTNPVGIIYSEYALQNPLCYMHLFPILAENGGWQIINTTPRGHNHAYRLFNQIKKNKDWYVSEETVATGVDHKDNFIIKPEDIVEAEAAGMSKELIAQEFFCSWESAMENAYFAKNLALSRKNGQIKIFPPPHKPVYTFWDIGIADLTTIWFVSFSEEHIYLIDYYQNSGMDVKHYIDYLHKYQAKNNTVWGKHFAPHDMHVRSYSTGKTRCDSARELGINFKVCPRPKCKINSIEIARGIFTLFVFHATRTQTGVDALMHYHASTNPNGGESGPNHDWSSHAADSFLLIGQAYAHGWLPIKKSEGAGSFRYNEGLMELII